jgi:predicted DNA-binding protein
VKEEIDFNLKTCESDKTLSLRVPSWMKDKLAAVARSKGTTMSAVALNLIKHGIMERVRE